MKTVAIIYGWAEGAWQGKKFTKALVKNGYKLVKDPRQADIIIGHSLGCYLIPPNIEHKTIVLIGLPYWPKRSIFLSVYLKLKNELNYHRPGNGFGWWINKLIHNGWYSFSRPQLSFYGIFRRSPGYLPDGNLNKVILIRPFYDTFCHPGTIKLLPTAKDYSLIEIPGAHDDCWFKPQPYIDLLPKEL